MAHLVLGDPVVSPTRDDILHYILGDILEVDELKRIEAALESDPQVAQWYNEIQAQCEPSAPAAAQARAMFGAMDQSIWSGIQLLEQLAGGGFPSQRAMAELPGGRQVHFTVTSAGDFQRLEFEQLPSDWLPASVVAFTPREPVEAACLVPSDFRRLVGEDLQSWPLSVAPDGPPYSVTLAFRSQAQRVTWMDPRACRMIRWEPR